MKDQQLIVFKRHTGPVAKYEISWCVLPWMQLKLVQKSQSRRGLVHVGPIVIATFIKLRE